MAASWKVKSGVQILCTSLYLVILMRSLITKQTVEPCASSSCGLYLVSSISTPSVQASPTIRQERHHKTTSMSPQMAINVGVHLLKPVGIVLLLLAISGDIEPNPGPASYFNGVKTRGLSIVHLNVRSLLGKLDELKLLVTTTSKNVDVLTLSETWLNSTISDAEVQIPGYTCIRKDRPDGKRGGGIMAYLRDGLPFRTRDDLNTNDAECLWFEIVRKKCKPLLICTIYRAPDANFRSFLTAFENNSPKINYSASDVILLGDFNVDVSSKKNPLKKQLINFTRSLDFTQLIKDPTRVTETSKSTIDLIFVNNEHRYTDSGVVNLSISDHSLVYCVLKVGKPKARPRTVEYRSYKNYDRKAFLKDLEDVPWNFVEDSDDVDASILTWNKLFLDVADAHAPVKKRRINGIPCPLMTSKIKKAMQSRDFHHRKATRTGSFYHWRKYRHLRNIVNDDIKCSRSKYYINLIKDSEGNANKLWKAVNKAACRKQDQASFPNCIVSNGVQYPESKSIANVLDSHFASIGQLLAKKISSVLPVFSPNTTSNTDLSFQLSPIDETFVLKQLKYLKTNKSIGLDNISARLLKDSAEVIARPVTSLLNLSLKLHSFPRIWKCAKVVALFKTGDRTDATNYRPISILPTLSKILERAVRLQLYEHLNANNLLSDKQYGFRPKRSTSTALASFADDILRNMDNGKLCGAVFLDLSR